jgi:signal transduction histidine kinase
MGRHLLAAAVVLADSALLVAGHRHDLFPWAGLAYVLLLWTSYQAGRTLQSRRAVAAVMLGPLAVQAASWPGGARAIPGLVAGYLVFVALPLVCGRYLAQHRRLVSVLEQRNRQLRSNREVIAEQERLRIARDMHDCLGRRLSLVSIQAAALEVSPLEVAGLPERRQAIGQLAAAARCALDELHELVGVLRRQAPEPAEAIAGLTEEFRAVGVQVALEQRGEPQPLSAAAAQAAYRMVEEGLTNAAKHAALKPVTVTIEWEPRSLRLTLANAVPDHPAPPSAGAGGGLGGGLGGGPGGGHGLAGLGERMALAGGSLDHGLSHGQFRLSATLPTSREDAAREDDAREEAAGEDGSPPRPRTGTAALAFAAAVLMFVALPAVMLLGVR